MTSKRLGLRVVAMLLRQPLSQERLAAAALPKFQQSGGEQSWTRLLPHASLGLAALAALSFVEVNQVQAEQQQQQQQQQLPSHQQQLLQAQGVQQAAQAAAGKVADPYLRPAEVHGLPSEIILYQYEVCPFCNKVKAFFDYNRLASLSLQIPYRKVEVSPLSKKELSWCSNKKVPVVLLDGEVMADSSAIISRIEAELEAQHVARTAPSSHPQRGRWWWPFGSSRARARAAAAASAAGQREQQQVAYQPGRLQPQGMTPREEEAYWRQWVDQRLVKVLTVNIYRTARESFQTFDYIAGTGNFSWFEAESARVVGAVMMWGISKRLVKKYGIEGDLRDELLACGQEWVQALDGRDFMGGSAPNLADLAVFGVVRAVTGFDTFMVLLHQAPKPFSLWYERMMEAVGPSMALPDAA